MAWRRTGPGAQALSAQLGRLSDGVIDMPESGYEPVLDDPATAGCLLAMVQALDVPWTLDSPGCGDGAWCVWLYPDDGAAVPHSSATLGRAAAAALLACWGEP